MNYLRDIDLESNSPKTRAVCYRVIGHYPLESISEQDVAFICSAEETSLGDWAGLRDMVAPVTNQLCAVRSLGLFGAENNAARPGCLLCRCAVIQKGGIVFLATT